jgi:L-2-hydroxyglutarate oxidase
MEMYRSVSKKAFGRSLQELIPDVTETDLVSAHAGVLAQALRSDGGLVDDFLIIKDRSSVHVCNAPSPAATASLEIAKEIVNRIPTLRTAITAYSPLQSA